MAKSFAKLAENNTVLNLVVVADKDCLDSTNTHSENRARKFLVKVHGWNLWKEHWSDGGSRKNPASIGGTYDEAKDAFIDVQPFPSWTLNETTCQWEPPQAQPEDNFDAGGPTTYAWDEPTTSWIAITFEDGFAPSH